MTYPIGTPLLEIKPRDVVCSGQEGVCPEIMSRMGYPLNRVPQDPVPGAASPTMSQPEIPKASWAPMMPA